MSCVCTLQETPFRFLVGGRDHGCQLCSRLIYTKIKQYLLELMMNINSSPSHFVELPYF